MAISVMAFYLYDLHVRETISTWRLRQLRWCYSHKEHSLPACAFSSTIWLEPSFYLQKIPATSQWSQESASHVFAVSHLCFMNLRGSNELPMRSLFKIYRWKNWHGSHDFLICRKISHKLYYIQIIYIYKPWIFWGWLTIRNIIV